MTAEIYTEKFVIKELKTLLKELKDNEEYIYIGELFENRNYGRQRFSEWITKFPDNKEIKSNSDTIKDILETRAVKGLLLNKTNATGTIFHLKNNYKWVDKQEIDQTNKTVNYTKEEWDNLSDKELDDIINK